MPLIIDKCPQCGIQYINSDDPLRFRWYCTDECESIGRPKKKDPDHTQLEKIIDLDDTDYTASDTTDTITSK